MELQGLADLYPSDPEPEYVDINEDNLAVVTLQENNHLVLVDLETGQVEGDFSATTANLRRVDATENSLIEQKESLEVDENCDPIDGKPKRISWSRWSTTTVR